MKTTFATDINLQAEKKLSKSDTKQKKNKVEYKSFYKIQKRKYCYKIKPWHI